MVPGLIDIHAHVFFGTEKDAYLSNADTAVQPDTHSFRSGQTTLVDAGGAGWRNFLQFKEQVIDRARTRVLSFINIVGAGMKGGPVEQNLADMDARLTAMRIRQHPGVIVGVKVAHYGGAGVGPGEASGCRGAGDRRAGDGRFREPHSPALARGRSCSKHLRPGDILTHTYAHVAGRTPIVDEQGKVRPYVWAARKRGIIFDVGHGGGSFLYRQAVPALQQGFAPDVISTDLHTGSMNAGMKDILNVMSKLLNLGMTLPDVIKANTSKAASVIKRPDLGQLSAGAEADIAVLSLRRGTFGFIDSGGGKTPGQPETRVRAHDQGRASRLGFEWHREIGVDRGSDTGERTVTTTEQSGGFDDKARLRVPESLPAPRDECLGTTRVPNRTRRNGHRQRRASSCPARR